MILGTGFAKIQLCDESGIEQYSYTLTGLLQTDLTQMLHPEELDTNGIEKMDNGYLKKIIAGKRIEFRIPIRIVESITPAGWETFIYHLWDWDEKIKLTPYIDKPVYTFWVVLEEGRMSERIVRNLLELDMIKFIGAERVSSVS